MHERIDSISLTFDFIFVELPLNHAVCLLVFGEEAFGDLFFLQQSTIIHLYNYYIDFYYYPQFNKLIILLCCLWGRFFLLVFGLISKVLCVILRAIFLFRVFIWFFFSSSTVCCNVIGLSPSHELVYTFLVRVVLFDALYE